VDSFLALGWGCWELMLANFFFGKVVAYEGACGFFWILGRKEVLVRKSA
jgi:hypothetical protein